MARGELFIVSAPSGAGKTTLIQRVMAGPLGDRGDLVFSVSHTTREPRAGEVGGRDYHFVERASFQEMVRAGRFLEWAEVHGNLYGTSRDSVFSALEAGSDVILDIDVQGADQVLARHPEAAAIFVLPPGFAALRQRLEGRRLDTPERVSERLAASSRELSCYQRYQYVIINREIDAASAALAAIIMGRRQRLERMREETEAVLRDFQAAFPGEQKTFSEPRAPTG